MPDALGLAVARLVVKYLLSEGEPVDGGGGRDLLPEVGQAACSQARWAYDGAAQGGKKIAFGNTWVVARDRGAAAVLPLAGGAAGAVPAVARQGHRLPGRSWPPRLVKVLAEAFPGRQVHGTGDAAFHGEPLVIEGTTWTTRLPANAVLHGPKPPPTGKRGRPREKGDRIGTCADAAPHADWRDTVIRAYGKDDHGAGRLLRRTVVRQLQVRARPARPRPGTRLRASPMTWACSPWTRTPARKPPPSGTPGGGPIEPSNATGKQLTGAATPATASRRPSSAPSRSRSSSSP